MSAPVNPPAFPRASSHISDNDLPLRCEDFGEPGMTLLDWFAGQALAGMLACPSPVRLTGDSSTSASHIAYEFADGLLRERARRMKLEAAR